MNIDKTIWKNKHFENKNAALATNWNKIKLMY